MNLDGFATPLSLFGLYQSPPGHYRDALSLPASSVSTVIELDQRQDVITKNDSLESTGTPARQRAVLVLGAGRSGTSLATRAIQAVGVELGDDFKPPSRKNPSGFFEDAALLRLSKKLRRALGLRPDSLRLLDESVWDGPVVAPFFDEFAATIRTRFDGVPVWGFKYARTMRLLPFWVRLFQQMDIEPSYVMPIRNPLSVARSRAKLDAHRGHQENSDLEWLVNVVPYFELVRDSRLVVMDYDRLVTESIPQMERVATRLDLSLTNGNRGAMDDFANKFLRAGLRHTRFTIEDLIEDRRINPLLRQAYLLLDRLAVDDLDSASAELWSTWQEINAGVNRLGPVLSRLDGLERDLRFAKWNPLSPFAAAWQEYKKFRGLRR